MRQRRAFRILILALFLWTAGLPMGTGVVRAVDGGDEPQPHRASVAGSGDTSHHVDGQGMEVWGVYDGHDLDQYLARSESPITFSMDLDRDFGPVDGEGHPIVTNELYGTTTKLTLRVYDVDEDYVETEFEPEIDTVWVNGIELSGFLSGANDQWSISTLDVPASILRLPTSANPNGTNQIEVRVDTANSGPDVWAVEIDWAELRTGFPATQATAFLHGILGQSLPNGSNSISAAEDFFISEHPILSDRTTNPTVPDGMTIQERADAVVEDVQDLAISSGAPRVNLVAHSLGGLVGRQLAWEHPYLVDDLVMLSTPNGGTVVAGALCGALSGAAAQQGGWFLSTELQCGGSEVLQQMSVSYVTGKFNQVVRDKLSTTYIALASDGDELVSPESAEYLSKDDPDHPGLHETRPDTRYDLEHGPLVAEGSPAFPDILCEPTMYPEAEVCAESATSLMNTPASQRAETLIQVQTATIPAGATSPIPLTFGGAQLATVEIAAAGLEGLSASFGGASFADGLLAGLVPSLSATISSPIDGTLNVTNSGTAPIHLDMLTFTDSSRRLTAEASIGPGTVALSAVLTEAGPTESVTARIVGDGGVVVREATLAPQGGGLYRATVAAPSPGMYAVAAETTGSAPRVAHYSLYVPEGGVSLGSGFSEATVGRGDGMIDQLVLSPTVTVTQNDTYAISADLRSSGGALVATAGTVATLSAGTHAVELAFDGTSIWESGASGPYVLANVIVAKHDSLGIEAEVQSLGSTSAYSVYDFRHDPVVFDADGFSDAAVDTNEDGSVDALSVLGSIAVDVGGSYALNAKLLAPDGSEIAQSQQTIQLVAGTNSFELSFNGAAIASSGKDGPYLVADLSAYPTANADTLGYLVVAHQTAAYTASQFDVAQGIERVNVSSTGGEANGDSHQSDRAGVAVSADGRYVAFASVATNLVAGDTNGVDDVFVHDRQTGATSRVSVSSDGIQAAGGSTSPTISADGRFVAFGSFASNLVAGDTNNTADTFVHDRQSGVTSRVSTSSSGAQASAFSSNPSISSDGRYVAFSSDAANLVSGDTNAWTDIFRKDRQTGTTMRVSVSSSGAQANGFSSAPSISSDGRYIAFTSNASKLVQQDTNSRMDVFVRDFQLGQTTRASVATSGSQGNDMSDYPSISADGRYVAFDSRATNLVAGDTNGRSDILVRDRQSGQTTRVSMASDGSQGNSDSSDAAMSGDGRYVAFWSHATNLVADDTNGAQEVFIHDRQTGAMSRGSIGTGGAQANSGSDAPSINSDGTYIAFQSLASNLVAGDTNGKWDVFVRTVAAP